jgi:RHS repeat-associated protein
MASYSDPLEYMVFAGSLAAATTLPNGGQITRSYDVLGRLEGTYLKNSGGATLNKHEYTYDDAHRLGRQTRTKGDYVEYAYDAAGQLRSAMGAEAGGTTNRIHERIGYAYDAAGNLQQRTNNLLVQSFSVDNLNQLTGASRSGSLTVAGVTTVDATSVTVADNGNSPVGALRYADRTFARTNVALLDGGNSFIATAQDSLGRVDSDTEVVNLPATVTYVYDSNGNLLSDGRRHFGYDDENQLTQVVVTNKTKSEFTYDGMMRRRVRKEYTWAGSWQQVLEVRYIYDGSLVAQERHYDTASRTVLPQRAITYTRGIDFSGTRENAGGIGGLLARSELSTFNNQLSIAFYHSDKVGNVSALVDTNQQIVARYVYEPFGNVLGMSGPLASGNTYRFSSKEAHDESGLVYYLYRNYEPPLQRWINRDPIQEQGGFNLYGFVGGDPVDRIDFVGWTPTGRAIGTVVGGLIGMGAGVQIGGAIGGGGGALGGTLVEPGGGTIVGGGAGAVGGAVIGGIIGTGVGGLIGGNLGDLISDAVEMARRESGQRNYINDQAAEEARRTGRNICDILDAMMTAAKCDGDTELQKAIKQAQKAAGCRRRG